MAEHNKLGKEGEKVAENHLKTKGYSIIERNWYSTHKELDLIAEFEGWLVIVEVKTRTGFRWERPEEAVNSTKIKHIVRAANHYVCYHKIDLPVRFDVISVIFEKGKWLIEHFEDAFLPPYK
jgi:putative endonuclease